MYLSSNDCEFNLKTYIYLLNYFETAKMSKKVDKLWTQITMIYIVILNKIHKLKLT